MWKYYREGVTNSDSMLEAIFFDLVFISSQQNLEQLTKEHWIYKLYLSSAETDFLLDRDSQGMGIA